MNCTFDWQGSVPEDVKLLPGQLLGIRQTVREAHPPPLPHRPPLPSFDTPQQSATASDSGAAQESASTAVYAHIDECCDSEQEEIASDAVDVEPVPDEGEADSEPDRFALSVSYDWCT